MKGEEEEEALLLLHIAYTKLAGLPKEFVHIIPRDFRHGKGGREWMNAL